MCGEKMLYDNKKDIISQLIIEIKKNQFPDFETISNWLESSLKYNGIYILGI